ncbi:Actin-related protein 4 [Dictyocoela muelleri]|nr:Actin-related protein 4 [Dictyocoela muelleri]
MFTTNYLNILTIDIGTTTTKIGYCGTEQPDIFETSKKFNYKSPINNSTIDNVETYTRLISSYIKEEIPLILVQNTFETRTDEVLKYLMERRIVKNILFIRSAIAELFGTGRSTGIVISMGGGSIQVSSVVDGCLTASKRMNLGGEEITSIYRKEIFSNEEFCKEFKMKKIKNYDENLNKVNDKNPSKEVNELQNNQLQNDHKTDYQLSNDSLQIKNIPEIKNNNENIFNKENNNEEDIFNKEDINEDDNKDKDVNDEFQDNELKINFEIDEFCREAKDATLSFTDKKPIVFEKFGLKVEIGSYRYEIPRKIIGEDGIPNLFTQVIEENDINIRNTLLNNTVIVGESRIKGMSNELSNILLPKYSRLRIIEDNNFASFLGCSILGSISLSKQLFITYKDYEEYGVGILKRKNSDWLSFDN